MQTIIEQITEYLMSLDWSYILTLILIIYGISNLKFVKKIRENLSFPQRYQVLIIGILYAVIIFLVRGYSIEKVENIFQSFVFTLVFHKLIVDKLITGIFKTSSLKIDN